MKKVARRFCVAAFLCIIPFIFISCRSAPTPYDGSAPVSIGIAWQSGKDNNNIKFASAQFPKRKTMFALFGGLLLIFSGLSVRKRA